jgi:thioredoxin 1
MKIKKALFLIFATLTPSLYAAELQNPADEVEVIKRGVTSLAMGGDVSNLITSGNVIVYFFVGWCGPCGTMTKIIENVAHHFPSITFIKVDVFANRPLSASWNVKGTPTLFFYKDGALLKRHTGVIQDGNFRTLLRQLYA